MTAYLVATIHPWNIEAFHRRTPALPGEWHLIDRRDDLTTSTIDTLQPRYVFFPHWSWAVPREIVEKVECIGFHMTDLPYGRGGSPLQNLILRGHKSTKLTALRYVEVLDSGPIYHQLAFDLSGSAAEIFERAADLVYDIIKEIVKTEPQPQPQPEPTADEAVIFRRRRPADSVLPTTDSLEHLFDHIRMLDAEGYPAAYLDYGDYRIEFHEARFEDDRVTARAVLRRRVEKNDR